MTGREAGIFQQVLASFEERTGIRVDYEGTRAITQVLRSAVQQGSPPDIAVLPSPQDLAQYIRLGDLKPLDQLTDESAYSEQWLHLQRIGKQVPYAVAIKVDLKSMVWFSTSRFLEGPPQTWEELLAVSESIAERAGAPWCVGMESAPTSGWPGTDWLEDILLHQSGPDVYGAWAAGELAWESPEVRSAWEEWGRIVGIPEMIQGGPKGALLTNFQDAGIPLATGTAGCVLEHQASFMLGFYQEHVDEQRGPAGAADPPVGFFQFPSFDEPERAVLVSADLAGMFNDTPQARQLMDFLATTEAQRVMPESTDGINFSANTRVYSDAGNAFGGESVQAAGVFDDIADTLTDGTRPLCFDASDLMPAPMRTAFYHAVLRYIHEPGALDLLLEQLDQVRRELNAREDDDDGESWFDADYACGG
jgi:alpha-glucoside transport system substrate-binding protein